MEDSIPAASTYYLLRKRIVEWEKLGNGNLIEQVFAQVTQSQVIDFEVNGKHIRMDSKLLGSNIAWYSRYELLHETLRKAYKDIEAELSRLSLSEFDIQLLNSINKESGNKVSYRCNKSEVKSKMVELGILMYKIKSQMVNHSSESLQVLFRVFSEQYTENEGNIYPKDKENISADSVQSPHDTECHYRSKGDNQVKGYSINVTETCDGNQPLNLITNVQVNVASTADCDFLQPSIEATQKVIVEQTEIANADGAYHSVDNQDYCKEKGIDLVLGAIQGQPSRYDLCYDSQDNLVVTDLNTNTIIPSQGVKSGKNGIISKWRIKNDAGKYRYFTQKEIDTSLLRKQIANRTPEALNIRNNVEASIFQLGYHYPNDKSRYRGLSKHKIWANVRCLWINFVRILNFLLDIAPNYANYVKKLFNMQFISKIMTFFTQIACANCVTVNLHLAFPKTSLEKNWKNGFFICAFWEMILSNCLFSKVAFSSFPNS
jgi:hypothetical protein